MKFSGLRSASFRTRHRVTRSGWCHLRAEGATGDRYPMDVAYVQGFTNPVWLQVGDQPIRNRAAADYALRWIDKLQDLADAWPGWRAEKERAHVFAQFDEARPLRLLIWNLVRGGLLDNRHHGSRDLAFGHDGRLYLSLGVPCNICMPESPLDSILSMDPDGGNEMIYATGIRNSVGMDFHPVTGELFFTDNGADSMGDESPPDELNRAHRAGLFFGFPYFGGGKDRTPQFRGQIPPREVTFPALELQPHAAALGLHFYRGDMFPAEYKHDAFIAQHGSWNRTEPVGYRLMRVRFNDQGRPTGQEVFAEGWLQPGGPWGRPNDVAEFPDGSLLVSDDVAGVIYRITYTGN